MLETIKSYLVSLGFSVDQASYQNTTKAINETSNSVAEFAGGSIKYFAAAAIAVVGFVTATSIGLAKFVGGLAQADMENEKLARQMWTSKDSAAAFDNSLKALGVTLEDLYLSPELMRNFQQLNREAQSLRAPKEFGEQMKLIRSVQFEFARMKLGATYALQWIGYYFIKYMETPIRSIKATLSEINGVIFKEMPSWTKVIAQVMSWFGRMGVAAFRAIKDVISLFAQLGKAIPDNVKIIGAAISGLAFILSTGPIGIFVAALVGVLLLLDDFYTYIDGGEAAFGPVWQKIIDFFDKLKESGSTFDKFKERIENTFDSISKAVEKGKKLFRDFYNTLKENGALDALKNTFTNTFQIIGGILDRADEQTKAIFEALQQDGVLKDLWNDFKEVVSAVFELAEAVTGLIKNFMGLEGTKAVIKAIGEFITFHILQTLKGIHVIFKMIKDAIVAVTKLAKGDFKGALSAAGDIFKDGYEGIKDLIIKPIKNLMPTTPSYAYPQTNTQNTTTQNVELNQTNHIYGSDPKATAEATSNKLTALYHSRNWSGGIQ